MRSLVKYLLFFIAFLSSGYGTLSSNEDVFSYSSAKNLKGSGYTTVGTIQYEQDFVVKSCPSGAERNFKIDIAENEVKEDELVVSKKHLGGGHFSSILLAQALGYYFNSSPKILSFYWYFSFASQHPYLVFRVFRI